MKHFILFAFSGKNPFFSLFFFLDNFLLAST